MQVLARPAAKFSAADTPLFSINQPRTVHHDVSLHTNLKDCLSL
jgi:hypothetical protein